MFIDKSRERFEELQKFEKWLEVNGYTKNEHFFCIEELWESICDCIKNNRHKTYFPFNGKYIIFDYEPITEDEVYLFICGMTKAERDAKSKKRMEEYENREKEYQSKLPALLNEYKEKVRKLVDEKYFEKANEVVESSLQSIYHEYLTDCLIEILEMEKQPFEEIKEKLLNQGHSGMSYSLTCFMFGEVSDRGKAFLDWRATNNG